MMYKVESAEDTMKEFRIKPGNGDVGIVQAFIDAIGRQGGEMFIVSTKAEDSYEKGYADGRADMIARINEIV